MRFVDFLKDKIIQIILILFSLITIEIFLIIYPIGSFIRIYIPLVIVLSYFIGLIIEYYNKKEFYNNVIVTLDELDEKYLITEIIKHSDFIEGKIFEECLSTIDKSMIDNVNKYKYLTEDYKEYIELWIHEIKIPIATSKMIIENNKNKVTKSIDEELNKVDDYTEQALYYARSNTVEKDYYIKSSKLADIVNECIKRNKSNLINQKAMLNLHDLDSIVNTDSKWIVFILNQIIQNSIKYKSDERILEFEIYSKVNKENVVLYIKDNGIGIKQSELSRVFEKGFTGENGRLQNKKSTGIGLFLCKKLCDKLGIFIEIESEYKEGTIIKLIFPKDSYTNIR